MSSAFNQETPMDVDSEPPSSSSTSNVPETASRPPQIRSTKKVLHICRSFKELQEQAKPPDELYDNLSDENLGKLANKCFQKAESSYHSGDEELAYIFYSYSIDADIELQSRSEPEVNQDDDPDYNEYQDDNQNYHSEDDNEDENDQQPSDPRQDHMLKMLGFLKTSLKSRYRQNWKQTPKTSADKSCQPKKKYKTDENCKEVEMEELLGPTPIPDIQLKVSKKDYAIQIKQMSDCVDLLNEKKKELKVIENLLNKLFEGGNEQKEDNVFKDFIPNDIKCEFGCNSVKGFVLGDNFVCKNGHRVCSQHRSVFPICPNCENEWLTLSENYFMSLERECPFAERGCQEKVKLEEMEKHLGICEWTVGNKQVLKLQWRKIVAGAKIMALEVKVEQEREKVEEMEEPLTKSGCDFAPMEILRQWLVELESAINGEKFLG